MSVFDLRAYHLYLTSLLNFALPHRFYTAWQNVNMLRYWCISTQWSFVHRGGWGEVITACCIKPRCANSAWKKIGLGDRERLCTFHPLKYIQLWTLNIHTALVKVMQTALLAAEWVSEWPSAFIRAYLNISAFGKKTFPISFHYFKLRIFRAALGDLRVARGHCSPIRNTGIRIAYFPVYTGLCAMMQYYYCRAIQTHFTVTIAAGRPAQYSTHIPSHTGFTATSWLPSNRVSFPGRDSDVDIIFGQ